MPTPEDYNFIPSLLRNNPTKAERTTTGGGRTNVDVVAAASLFNNSQPIGVGARGLGPWWVVPVRVPKARVCQDKRSAHTTQCGFLPAMAGGRTSCPWPEAAGDRANVDWVYLPKIELKSFL